MSNRRVEEQIEALDRLRDAVTEAAAATLRKALADRVNLVVAKAAKMAAELQMGALIPDLVRAFQRLLDDGAARDPQCWGKNALARALTQLDYRESAIFQLGARHTQMEAVWGGQEDTAGSLRGTCMLALVACSDVTRGQILRALVDGLAEPAHTVRVEAVRGIAQMQGDEAALLLRLKARLGDAEPSVTGQVFDGLLSMEGAEALDFVASFLAAPDEAVREEAALALGASRHPGALERLCEAWKSARISEGRAVLLRAISSSRQEEALVFLLDIVRRGRRPDVRDAMEALSLHRDSPEIRRQAEEAARQGGGPAEEQFQRCFA